MNLTSLSIFGLAATASAPITSVITGVLTAVAPEVLIAAALSMALITITCRK